MDHEWKIGDWAELYDGTRYLIVKAWYQGDCQFVNAYSGSGAVRTFSIGATNIKHLPDCTGWEWEPPKPIEPPPGYRLIREGGFVAKGDLVLTNSGHWCECLSDGTSMTGDGVKAYASKIEPTYRPFANADEFEPYRDKWLVDEDGEIVRVIRILANAKIATCHGSISFKDALVRYRFEDGTPFGVLETEEKTCNGCGKSLTNFCSAGLCAKCYGDALANGDDGH